ncbi:MAG TPA: ABC transporter ATP-binding protein [Aggregatilineales bacterium]|nr:ABC transporter ATP-binding protein [Aggregatilineales bacterium]
MMSEQLNQTSNFQDSGYPAEVGGELAVECKKVERTFGSGDSAVRVLRGLDLNVKAGQLVALYGPSGSGKTTLVNLIGTLDIPSAGTIRVLGRDVVRMSDAERAEMRRKEIGFIFQSYALLPTYTALENIDLALRLPHLGYGERRQRGKAALEAMGLTAWANHVPDELSGGQRQRVAIARALAMRPKLLLADEPTGGLDTRTTRRVLSLFRGIAQAQGTTFVIVSHDPLVAEHVDVAYDLQDGKLVLRLHELSSPAAPDGQAA